LAPRTLHAANQGQANGARPRRLPPSQTPPNPIGARPPGPRHVPGPSPGSSSREEGAAPPAHPPHPVFVENFIPLPAAAGPAPRGRRGSCPGRAPGSVPAGTTAAKAGKAQQPGNAAASGTGAHCHPSAGDTPFPRGLRPLARGWHSTRMPTCHLQPAFPPRGDGPASTVTLPTRSSGSRQRQHQAVSKKSPPPTPRPAPMGTPGPGCGGGKGFNPATPRQWKPQGQGGDPLRPPGSPHSVTHLDGAVRGLWLTPGGRAPRPCASHLPAHPGRKRELLLLETALAFFYYYYFFPNFSFYFSLIFLFLNFFLIFLNFSPSFSFFSPNFSFFSPLIFLFFSLIFLFFSPNFSFFPLIFLFFFP